MIPPRFSEIGVSLPYPSLTTSVSISTREKINLRFEMMHIEIEQGFLQGGQQQQKQAINQSGNINKALSSSLSCVTPELRVLRMSGSLFSLVRLKSQSDKMLDLCTGCTSESHKRHHRSPKRDHTWVL